MMPVSTSHDLVGFGAAATAFVSALDANRQRIADDAGLSRTQLRALFRISQAAEITPKELGRYLGVTTGAVTAIVQTLVDHDLVARVEHPRDRRSLLLTLSAHGHEVMAGIHDDFERMITEATRSLDSDELAAFVRALDTVATEVRRLTPPSADGGMALA